VSRNGTLSLEHDHRGNSCRIYAEKHYVEWYERETKYVPLNSAVTRFGIART
jgi:hypothetical protein